MKKLFAVMLVALPVSSFAQGLVEVEVANVPLPVEPAVILPESLRSQTGTITAKAGETIRRTVSFNDLLVGLLEVSWVPTDSTRSGICRWQIEINNKVAKISAWAPTYVEIREPPVAVEGAVEVEIREPTVANEGVWQSSNIVLTPNDAVTLVLSAADTDRNERGECSADYVVLAESRLVITDGQ